MAWGLFGKKENNKNNIKRNPAHSVRDNSNGISADEIRSIVNSEVANVNMKNQILKYMSKIETNGLRTETVLNEIEARGLKTETVLNEIEAQGMKTAEVLEELKGAVGESISRIQEMVAKESSYVERLSEINESVTRIEKLSYNLEESIRKENLIMYRNTKELIDKLDDKARERTKKLKYGMILLLILGVLAVGGITFSILLQLNIIIF